MVRKTFFCLLCITFFFFSISCTQERQDELAKKRCNDIPCEKGSCFFWNDGEHRCITDAGLEEIEKYRNGADSLFVQEYVRNILDKQIDIVHNEYMKKNAKILDFVKKVQKGRKKTDPIYQQSQHFLNELGQDSALYKMLKRQEDSLLTNLNNHISVYKIYRK